MVSLIEMASPAAELLLQHRQTVSVGESSSGGLISAALLAVPGASAYYVGGTVLYSLQSRRALLDLSDEQREAMRPGGKPYLLTLGRVLNKTLNSTWAITEIGIAGPTASSRSQAQPGHTGIAVVGPIERTLVIETGHNDREKNMWEFAQAGLNLLAECIQES